MNPHQLAKEECANYDGGGCRNIIILDDLTNHVGPRLERCKLLDGQKCRHFEDCVLHMIDYIEDEKRKDKLVAVAEQYFNEAKEPDTSKPQRLCPDCGAVLKPRKRYCADCAEKKRKKTRRLYIRKYRSGRNTVNQKNAQIS